MYSVEKLRRKVRKTHHHKKNKNNVLKKKMKSLEESIDTYLDWEILLYWS